MFKNSNKQFISPDFRYSSSKIEEVIHSSTVAQLSLRKTTYLTLKISLKASYRKQLWTVVEVGNVGASESLEE